MPGLFSANLAALLMQARALLRRPATRWAGGGALLAALGAAALAAFWPGGEPGRDTAGPAQRPAAPVIVQPVELQSDAAVISAIGTGRAVQSVTLYPEAAGLVTELLFTAGRRAAAGTPLLQLDADDQRLALELANLEARSAQQRLARYEKVVESGAVSASEVDQARTVLSTARIAVSRAELALRRRTLLAPFDGVAGLPQVEPGDRVTVTTPIATFDDRSALLIDFDVPEAFARGVQPGDAVQVTSWATSGEHITGTVEAVASRIDPDARTLQVRARIPNAGDRFRPGMSFSVRLALAGSRYPAVPSVSVQWDRGGAHIWRVTGGAAERLDVRLLRRSGGWVLVDAPLSAGDRVVVEGVQRLSPGTRVREVPASDVARSGGQGHGQ